MGLAFWASEAATSIKSLKITMARSYFYDPACGAPATPSAGYPSSFSKRREEVQPSPGPAEALSWNTPVAHRRHEPSTQPVCKRYTLFVIILIIEREIPPWNLPAGDYFHPEYSKQNTRPPDWQHPDLGIFDIFNVIRQIIEAGCKYLVYNVISSGYRFDLMIG